MRVLIVDDEKSIRITLSEFLKDDGHYVRTASDAEQALDVLREDKIDIVISDIILPRVSGLELLRTIRQESPDIQVIMMTGEPTAQTVSESMQFGAAAYLQKPVSKFNILRALSKALRTKEEGGDN